MGMEHVICCVMFLILRCMGILVELLDFEVYGYIAATVFWLVQQLLSSGTLQSGLAAATTFFIFGQGEC